MGPGAHSPSRLVAGDDELMTLVAGGREDALAELYDRYAADLFRTALRIVGDRGAAEDVVQDTFLAAWDRRAWFDPGRGAVGAWLSTIARHRAIDRLRAAGRGVRPVTFTSVTDGWPDEGAGVEWLIAAGDPVTAGSPELPPEGELVRAETIEELAAAVAGLPEEERVPILMAYRDGLSQSEIAERLGWPLGTVKTRSRRALQRLRRVVEATEPTKGASADAATEAAVGREAAVAEADAATEAAATEDGRAAPCCGAA